MIACRAVNAWPFANPVQTATLAQLLMYDEALRRLSTEAEEKAPPLPRRLKGEAWEMLKRKAAAVKSE